MARPPTSRSATARRVASVARLGGPALRSTGWAIVTATILGAALVSSVKLFGVARTHVARQDRFRTASSDLQITPLPVWLHIDLIAEVRRRAGLPDTLHTLDPKLTEQLCDAFQTHPWVRAVTQVRVVHPARVEVQLEYREPVALVGTARGVELVDRDGVLLPAGDLASPAIYLVVNGIGSTPTGPPGTPWEDARVRAAAATAAAISPFHRTLGITAIDAASYRPDAPGQGHLYLLTERGSRIKWGRPPDVDYPGELGVQAKLDRLLGYAAEHGSLDSPAGPYEIDVTAWEEIVLRPRGE